MMASPDSLWERARFHFAKDAELLKLLGVFVFFILVLPLFHQDVGGRAAIDVVLDALDIRVLAFAGFLLSCAFIACELVLRKV